MKVLEYTNFFFEMVKNMSLVSQCERFPGQTFYFFPYHCLHTVSDFQKEKEDRVEQGYPIALHSYHDALCTVATMGKIPVAREILNLTDASLFRYGNYMGRTPLICAIISSQYVMAKFLIRAKADVNIATPAGNTPLWYAVKMRQVRLAEFLMNKDAVVEPQLSGREMPIIERAQMALNYERRMQEAFLRELRVLLGICIPNIGEDVS